MGKANVSLEMEACAKQLHEISNPIRLQIIRNLQNRPSSVKELLKTIPIEQNLMSHHLKKLRKASLVTRERNGKSMRYMLMEDVSIEGSNAINLGCCILSFES